MTPMMHERVLNLFVNAGLTSGFTVQQLMYDDPGNHPKRSWYSGQTAEQTSATHLALNIM